MFMRGNGIRIKTAELDPLEYLHNYGNIIIMLIVRGKVVNKYLRKSDEWCLRSRSNRRISRQTKFKQTSLKFKGNISK